MLSDFSPTLIAQDKFCSTLGILDNHCPTSKPAELLLTPLILAPPRMSLALNLGTDPLTERAIMSENIAISIHHSTNNPLYPSHRQVVSLALNEVGRRTKRGFVYWIEDDQYIEWHLNAPALFYIPYEWTEKDRKEFDDDPSSSLGPCDCSYGAHEPSACGRSEG